MSEINLNSLPNKSLAGGDGYLFGLDSAGLNVTGWKMPVSDVKAGTDLASTALQPVDVADMAYEDPADWVPRDEHDATVASLTATTVFLQEQITQLQALIGVGSIGVFDADVYEPGVYA